MRGAGRHEGDRRWASDVLTPEPPTVPQTEVAVVRVGGCSGEQPQHGSPLLNLVGRRVQVSFSLRLVFAGRVRDESNARVSGKACRTDGYQPRPGKIACDDPVRRRQV